MGGGWDGDWGNAFMKCCVLRKSLAFIRLSLGSLEDFAAGGLCGEVFVTPVESMALWERVFPDDYFFS